MKPLPITAKDGQESVWDYPRPPRIEASARLVVVKYMDTFIAGSRNSLRVLETSLAPSYYVPPEDVSIDLLQPSVGGTWCEWKGEAQYFDLVLGEARIHKVAWTYTDPLEGFEPIAGFLSFYPGKLACYLDGEQARPQAGGFYGGWITNDLVGPFKGEPGSHGW